MPRDLRNADAEELIGRKAKPPSSQTAKSMFSCRVSFKGAPSLPFLTKFLLRRGERQLEGKKTQAGAAPFRLFAKGSVLRQ